MTKVRIIELFRESFIHNRKVLRFRSMPKNSPEAVNINEFDNVSITQIKPIYPMPYSASSPSTGTGAGTTDTELTGSIDDKFPVLEGAARRDEESPKNECGYQLGRSYHLHSIVQDSGDSAAIESQLYLNDPTFRSIRQQIYTGKFYL